MFKPPSAELPLEEMTNEILFETISIYSRLKDLRKFFNSRNLAKAVATTKEMIHKMMEGEEPLLENLFLTILAKAQEGDFWQKMDEVALNLCKQRNNWLDNFLYYSLLVLIDETVVGPRSAQFQAEARSNYGSEFDEAWLNANLTNSTERAGYPMLDAKTYFGQKQPIWVSRLKFWLLENFFTMEGHSYHCINSKCQGQAYGIPSFRIAVQTLVPDSLERLFSEPSIEERGDNRRPSLSSWSLPR